jgi:hypothetical protein
VISPVYLRFFEVPKSVVSPTDMENKPPEKITDTGYISRFS